MHIDESFLPGLYSATQFYIVTQGIKSCHRQQLGLDIASSASFLLRVPTSTYISLVSILEERAISPASRFFINYFSLEIGNGRGKAVPKSKFEKLKVISRIFPAERPVAGLRKIQYLGGEKRKKCSESELDGEPSFCIFCSFSTHSFSSTSHLFREHTFIFFLPLFFKRLPKDHRLINHRNCRFLALKLSIVQWWS